VSGLFAGSLLRWGVGALAVLLTIAAFVAGFGQIGLSEGRGAIGLVAGICSAAAWSLASVVGNPRWGSYANLFAAVFAALSLGYATPGDALCQGGLAVRPDAYIFRTGSHWVPDWVCRLRAPASASSERLFEDLGYRFQSALKASVINFATEMDKIGKRIDALDAAEQADRRDNADKTSAVARRVDRLEQQEHRAPRQ